MQTDLSSNKSFLKSAQGLTAVFSKLKEIYNVGNEISEEDKHIIDLIKKNGYLPYPHFKALNELTPKQTILGLEEKFKYEGTYNNNEFVFSDVSPVKRLGYTDSSWFRKEQHSIKLINLQALGNGLEEERTANFIEILKQILILPSGNKSEKITATTMYLIPFHPREFGCAYLPRSFEVSEALQDKFIFENIGFSAKQQVQLIIAFAQLAGHPVIYDILPQTGRFSKGVLAKPEVARWFDVKTLMYILRDKILSFSCNDEVKNILICELMGEDINVPEHLTEEVSSWKHKLIDIKKKISNYMMSYENQQHIQHNVKSIIKNYVQKNNVLESDITDHNEIINALIVKGYWPAPGGAWNSCGVPIFDKMEKGAVYPKFRHYNIDNEDVTHFANLDCQTPYYFVQLENGHFNMNVVSYFIFKMLELQADYNFDGFRVDHIDHIVDRVSELNGRPISYRAPRKVLGSLNKTLKQLIPHFATLGEYMLWDKFYKEYNKDMGFDALWGDDIVSQSQKNISQIAGDIVELKTYNEQNQADLTILKTYNNQDGEFREIDQYPGQLGFWGALFKWFKYRFFVGGENAARPILYIDGDESFTKTGIERVIGDEISMIRNDDNEFFELFNAIQKFAISNEFCLKGKSFIKRVDEDGFVVWENIIAGKDESLLIVSNQQAPTEKVREYDNGDSVVNIKGGTLVANKTFEVEDGMVISEYVYDSLKKEFVNNILKPTATLSFDVLKPSEFKVYKVKK